MKNKWSENQWIFTGNLVVFTRFSLFSMEINRIFSENPVKTTEFAVKMKIKQKSGSFQWILTRFSMKIHPPVDSAK